jgi:hypothetical protein
MTSAVVLVAACRDAVQPTTSARRAASGASAEAEVSASYDSLTLQQWFPPASEAVLALSTAVYADLNEETSRLEFGVVDEETRQTAIDRLAALGIPSDAYLVEIVGPIVLEQGGQALQDKIRPTVGGIQIQSTTADNKTRSCTLGFNIQQAGKRYFVTASHCTQIRGGVEQTPFYQSKLAGQPGSSMGVENRDPVYVAGGGAGCPANRSCRASDAALVLYNAATAPALSRIARPDGVNNGSFKIDAANPLFEISAVASVTQFRMGDNANKVGRTTGWTQGPVTRTCANFNPTDANGTDTGNTLLCQTMVRFNSQGGDSGGPVFQISADGTVVLLGIVIGNQNVNAVVHGWFSPFPAIAKELGFTTISQ